MSEICFKAEYYFIRLEEPSLKIYILLLDCRKIELKGPFQGIWNIDALTYSLKSLYMIFKKNLISGRFFSLSSSVVTLSIY